jgi:mono/diheme cytochrome c family protein
MHEGGDHASVPDRYRRRTDRAARSRRRDAGAAEKATGLDKVEANCQACHSLDYIPMNSPFPNAALWDAEITKMIKAYGAPIDDADAKAIADYLKSNYGS